MKPDDQSISPSQKARANKLDPYRESIRDWAAEGKTLADIVAQLRADGLTTSISSVGEYLQRMRSDDAEKSMFALIASGGRMNKELDEAFQKNPAPEIARLIEMNKTLIMSLQVHGAANPKLLALANSMQQTVLNYLSGVTKAQMEERKLAIDERKIKLLESKAAKADAAESVAHSNLSPEEQASRIRAIFKRE